MLNKNPAPVVLFVYNRPRHTQQTLESLANNLLAKATELYVFADGPKQNATTEDKDKIAETRNIIKNATGFKNVILVEKETNEGLAQSVISGVTEIVNKHNRVIVLEDDLIVSSFFLDFMNDGLELYDSSQNIYSINGFMFPIEHEKNETVLLPYTSTWGWATWKSKWTAFNTKMLGKEFLKNNPFLEGRFNLGDYSYTDMLDYGNNAWGIKWYFSVFLRGGLNVFPTYSLVKNIGFDGSGTNGGNASDFHGDFRSEKVVISHLEGMDLEFFNKFINYFKKENISLLRRLINRLKKGLKA